MLQKYTFCPVMVLTATATGEIMSTIEKSLKLREPTYITGRLNRKNIFYLFMKKKQTEEASQDHCCLYRISDLKINEGVTQPDIE